MKRFALILTFASALAMFGAAFAKADDNYNGRGYQVRPSHVVADKFDDTTFPDLDTMRIGH